MKIIKQGTLPEDKIYSCTCWQCKAEFEFMAKEGEVKPDYRNGSYIAIACPVCNKSSSVTV